MSTLSTIAGLYNPKKKKLENYLKRAATLRLNAVTTDTVAHKKCNIAKGTLFNKEMKNVVIMQTILSMADVMPTKSYSKVNRSILENIGCGTYTSTDGADYLYNYVYLYSNIQEAISEKKIIYLMLGMQEYCLVEGAKENFYSTHSTCLILIPGDDEYNAYYINSHGRDMVDTCNFVRKITKRRTKTVSFKHPYELVFIRDLIDYWNTLKDFNDKPIQINWTRGPEHTYWSTDLQAGDYHGLCFMFPQVLLHHMGEFYKRDKCITTRWGEIRFNSGEKLLKDGKLDVFVKYAFTCFSDDYTKIFNESIEKSYKKSENDPLQIFIEKGRTAFVKCILCSLVRYMCQI